MLVLLTAGSIPFDRNNFSTLGAATAYFIGASFFHSFGAPLISDFT